MIRYYTDKTISPGVLIEQSVQQLIAVADEFAPTQHLVIQFTHIQYYLPERPELELLALVSINKDNSAPVIEGSIFLFTPERLEQLRLLSDGLSNNSYDRRSVLKCHCHNYSLPWLVISDPWLLVPIYMPKPWGQEIWYTGIEARGQAEVAGDFSNIPLPWLLELMAGQVGLSVDSQPILLKVLDPLPDEVYGDLYFELHQEKQEVYVVIDIDQKAWPGGIGAIQLGFDAQVRQHYKTADQFKRAYLDAVRAYQQVRHRLDSQLDEKKIAAGIETNQTVTSSQLIDWINALSQQFEYKKIIEEEIKLRNAMNSFVHKHPLVVGDVVIVPTFVPHALQHGVRVVEFQTPVYERKILSFAQKVLTQSHWDTEEALELADMGIGELQSPELVSVSPHVRIERIVNFNNFEVQRIHLNGRHIIHVEIYSVLMVLHGQLTLGCAERIQNFDSGNAALLLKGEKAFSSNAPSLFLLALPKRAMK